MYAPERRPPRTMRCRRFAKRAQISDNRSSVTTRKLVNFYDFRNSKDVIRYKMRLQDGLHSTDSTRLPTEILIHSERVGPTSCGEI